MWSLHVPSEFIPQEEATKNNALQANLADMESKLLGGEYYMWSRLIISLHNCFCWHVFSEDYAVLAFLASRGLGSFRGKGIVFHHNWSDLCFQLLGKFRGNLWKFNLQYVALIAACCTQWVLMVLDVKTWGCHSWRPPRTKCCRTCPDCWLVRIWRV